MSDHLFPESTTYVHSYVPHEITPRKPFVSDEDNIVEYLPPALGKKTLLRPETKTNEIDPDSIYLFCRSALQKIPLKEPSSKRTEGPTQSTTGNVDISNLTAEEKEFFLSKTYRTTYDDYSKAITRSTISQAALKNPFGRLDDQMLLVLNATKPNLAYYGFGLPNKCCVAWGTVQSRTLPSEARKHVVEKRRMSNPFPGYPDKMYPHIQTGELSPQYDGSFAFGYTGHQRSFLEYPEDVTHLLRRDFPKHIPVNLTTNQATLIHKPIPECERRAQEQKLLDQNK